MDGLSLSILTAMTSKENPLHTIYTICRCMGMPMSSSKNPTYVRIYRRVQRLVKDGYIYEISGTRDPSVFISKEVLKGRK
jgi:hypothetical protein